MGSVLQKVVIFALHGFLGQGSDWDQIKNQLPENFEFVAPSFFSNNESDFDLTNFDTAVESISRAVSTISAEKIFIGYSLGGRIGLHILKKYPDLFSRYIFLSTHSGISVEAEKKQRLHSDLIWADKLVNLSWDDFLNDWNSQTVFKNDIMNNHRESSYNQTKLRSALTALSLGQQAEMSASIAMYKRRINWVVGSSDQKFLDLAEGLKQKKILDDYSRILGGHRILLNPDSGDLIKIILQQPAR